MSTPLKRSTSPKVAAEESRSAAFKVPGPEGVSSSFQFSERPQSFGVPCACICPEQYKPNVRPSFCRPVAVDSEPMSRPRKKDKLFKVVAELFLSRNLPFSLDRDELQLEFLR